VWVGVLGLTAASLAVWQYWRTSLKGIDARLAEDARAIAERITVQNELLEIEIDAAIGIGSGLQADERYYGVYDASGQLIDGTSGIVPDRLTSRFPRFLTRAGYREALVEGPRESMVVVGQALAPVLADLRRLAVSLLLASLFGAALALPAAVWLRRQLASSIAHIDETARSLAPGQPTRIDVGGVAEEFVGVAATLNDAFDRLAQALARERQLTSDASHELRTPVTTLVAETQWALGGPRSADEYRRSLEVCARQGLRMKDLVESLLTLARLESGTLPPARTEIRLRPLVVDTVADLRPLASHHRVTVYVDGDATVRADRVQMRILLSNLLSNAIRYNRAGGEVHVYASSAGGRAVITVRDTGAGLDPALASHVFERFWRADPARSGRDAGSGLGLAISKAIVDAHGGMISVNSAPAEGTTFVVELPLSGSGPAADRATSR